VELDQILDRVLEGPLDGMQLKPKGKQRSVYMLGDPGLDINTDSGSISENRSKPEFRSKFRLKAHIWVHVGSLFRSGFLVGGFSPQYC
jgi:hypothetical protein